MNQAPLALDNNGSASIEEREGRAKVGTGSGGIASSRKVRLGNNQSSQLGPLHRGPGYESRRVLLFCPDLR